MGLFQCSLLVSGHQRCLVEPFLVVEVPKSATIRMSVAIVERSFNVIATRDGTSVYKQTTPLFVKRNEIQQVKAGFPFQRRNDWVWSQSSSASSGRFSPHD
jgi:hypothetical protein